MFGAASPAPRRGRSIVVSLLIAAGVLAAPITASADLPKLPACSRVASTLLKSTFGFSFSSRPTAKEQRTKTFDHLRCTYTSRSGDLSVDYYRYTSDNAARAHYVAVKTSLIRQGNNGSGITQLLPLIKLHGIGDIALRSTDGTVVEFVDGIDCVELEHGFANVTPQTTRGMVALATYIDRHG